MPKLELDCDANYINIKISKNELYILSNSLNEVTAGFYIPDFETQIGASKEEVGDLKIKILEIINKIHQLKDSEKIKPATYLEDSWFV